MKHSDNLHEEPAQGTPIVPTPPITQPEPIDGNPEKPVKK